MFALEETIDEETFDMDDFERNLRPINEEEYLKSFAVSVSSEIKASDFDGIEIVFGDKEEEADIGYAK